MEISVSSQCIKPARLSCLSLTMYLFSCQQRVLNAISDNTETRTTKKTDCDDDVEHKESGGN